MNEKLSILKKNFLLILVLCMMSSQFNFAQCTLPPSITYQGVASTYATGTPITPLLPNNTGSTVNTPTTNTAIAPIISTIGSGMNFPNGVDVDASGALYVAVASSHQIQKIVGSTVTTIGSGYNTPVDVAVDSNGVVYVADYNNNAIKKIDGSTITVLGSGFDRPTSVAVGNDGAVYVADYGNSAVKKIVGTTVTTLGGGFFKPSGVAVDAAGVVYVVDYGNNAVKKIVGATVTLLPGTYYQPWAITVDNAGSIYVAERGNWAVKKIVGNIATTIATGIESPAGVAVDLSGTVYVPETKQNSLVKKLVYPKYSISPNLPTGMNFNIYTGTISGTPTVDTVATTYTITTQNSCGIGNTTITFATCTAPITTSINVTESSGIANDKIIYPGTPVTLSATNGATYSWNTGLTTSSITVYPTATTTYTVTATSATGCKDVKSETITVLPHTLTPAPTGITEQVYAGSWTLNDIIVNGSQIKWYTTATGNIVLNPTTNVTNGSTYYASQTINDIESSLRLSVTTRKISEATQAFCGETTIGSLISNPTFGISNWFSTNTSGTALTINTIITESGNYYIERNVPEFTSLSIGNGYSYPTGIAAQSDGKLWICDTTNNQIKRMSLDGSTIEIVGSGFNKPTGIAIDANNTIWIADKFNHAIKRMNSNGTNIQTLGSGFNYPNAIAIQNDGKIWITDTNNNQIKMMNSDGTNIISVGSGFNRPNGIAIQNDGKILIADSGNNAIKRMNPDGSNIVTLGNGFAFPRGVALQSDGKILIADSDNNFVKRMNSDGSNIVILGNRLSSPSSLIEQNDGTLWVADSNGNAIKKLLPAGTSNRVAVTITINPLPATPIANAQTFCNNSSTIADIVVTGSGNLQFYSNAIGGTALNPNTVLTTGTYYVSQIINSCESLRTSIPITILIPNTSITINGNTLSATQSGVNYQWYKCPNTLLTGETNQSYTPTITGDYRLEITVPGCSTVFTSDCMNMSTNNYFTKIATNPEVVRGWFGQGNFEYAMNVHRLAINSNGTLWASGNNKHGQLGDGTNVNKIYPIQIGTRTDWVNIAVGWNFSLGITNDGKLWSWGSNHYATLGEYTNNQTSRNLPVQVGTANNWIAISAGAEHAAGITADGKLWVWGSGSLGQLGDGSTHSYIPKQLGTATNWVAVECGTYCTFAINSEGKLWFWGYGISGNGTGFQQTNTPVQVGNATNWASISCGAGHNIALTSDGKLWAWGENDTGQLGDNSTTDNLVPTQIGSSENWASISTGYWASSAIDNDGKLWTWGYDGCFLNGDNYVVTPTLTHNNSVNWESINGNASSYFNIKSDGSVLAFGAQTTCYTMDPQDEIVESFHSCSPTIVLNAPNFTNLAPSGSSVSMYQNSYNMYNNNDALIASVSQRVASLFPIKGTTTAKVWVESNQPSSFVKRHYEIMPTTNAATVKGKVTLYFTQSEFDDYNSVNSIDLPTNASDIAGIERLTITKMPGYSNDNTGLPTSYASSPEIIDPHDADIVWNADQNRWEISFITTGFGGFFIGISPTEVNLKLFIEGYYDSNNHVMVPVKANQGVGSNTTQVDDITVELRNANDGSLKASTTAELQTNGTALSTFTSAPRGSYFIVVKHRNSLETWSTTPQTIGTIPITYDFSSAANKAYGSNQVMLETGVYGFYSGDTNQDGFVDSLDITPITNDSDSFIDGYVATDINGDGVVDSIDFPIVFNNADNFVETQKPFATNRRRK